MQAIIKIDMDNAAFSDGELYHFELAAILRNLANKVESKGESSISIDVISLRDSNGNRVGQLEILP